MSRSSAPRGLTLTEELEKLEQSITLTLQEIDHNFSKAHRIVTTSILPIVEQYAKHSNDVWEGSKVDTSSPTIPGMKADAMNSSGSSSSKPQPTSLSPGMRKLPWKMTSHTRTLPQHSTNLLTRQSLALMHGMAKMRKNSRR